MILIVCNWPILLELPLVQPDLSEVGNCQNRQFYKFQVTIPYRDTHRAAL